MGGWHLGMYIRGHYQVVLRENLKSKKFVVLSPSFSIKDYGRTNWHLYLQNCGIPGTMVEALRSKAHDSADDHFYSFKRRKPRGKILDIIFLQRLTKLFRSHRKFQITLFNDEQRIQKVSDPRLRRLIFWKIIALTKRVNAKMLSVWEKTGRKKILVGFIQWWMAELWNCASNNPQILQIQRLDWPIYLR